MSFYKPKLTQLQRSKLLTLDERIQILELEVDKLARDVLNYKNYVKYGSQSDDVIILSDTEDELIDIVVELTELQAAEQKDFVNRLLCHESVPKNL